MVEDSEWTAVSGSRSLVSRPSIQRVRRRSVRLGYLADAFNWVDFFTKWVSREKAEMSLRFLTNVEARLTHQPTIVADRALGPEERWYSPNAGRHFYHLSYISQGAAVVIVWFGAAEREVANSAEGKYVGARLQGLVEHALRQIVLEVVRLVDVEFEHF